MKENNHKKMLHLWKKRKYIYILAFHFIPIQFYINKLFTLLLM